MSKQICHAHCPKPGGGLAAVLVVLAAIVIAATARAVVHAAEFVLEVAAIAVTSAVVLAVLGGVAVVAARARRNRANRVTRVSFPAPVLRLTAESISAPRRRAIEAPRPSLAELEALAAEHGYDIVRRDRGD